MAPLVVRDKVLVGNSGGEYGGEDLGVASWPPDAWRIGGGTVWGWLSYDPEANLLYHGTANPGPWNPEQRPGDNKWTAGMFARDPDTGEAVWFYQWTPHDLHDYDGVNENVLINLEWEGRPRKALAHPDRNGYVYLLDRLTGEVLYAKPFAAITSSKGVDLKSGRLIQNPDKEQQIGRVTREICPASPGGKDWQPSAYSPKTKLLYIPTTSSARTPSRRRPATSWARRMSAWRCACTRGRAAIAASSLRGTWPPGARSGQSRRTFRRGAGPPSLLAMWCSTAPWMFAR
jgi:glucose dehydrogenase